MAEIVERADGVPLFIEELTKAVLETDHSNAKTVLSGVAPNALAVPATLHASLMARLDRLGSAAKEVAQMGAAIGREFSYELLAAVAQRNGPQLDAALDQLVGAGLALRQSTPPQATFLFKHALVQDAAYGTLLRGKRRDLHRCITRVLEEQFPDTAEAQPEVLAYHCARAGLIERAIGYYERAAQRAIARSAMTEAVAQLNKGLELLTNLPDDAARQRQEFELLIALGKSLMVAKGYASPEVGQTYARAVAICEQLGYSPKIGLPAVNGRWAYHIMKGELRPARALATDILRRAENDGDGAVTVLGHRSSGIACFHLGELSISRTHLEKAIAKFDPVHRPFYTAVTLQDVYVTLQTYLSHSLFCLGCLDKSRSESEKAIEEAGRLNPYSITHSLSQACFVDWATRSQGGIAATDRCDDRRRGGARISLQSRGGTIFRGWARAMSGQSAEGVALLRDGLDAYRATGAAVFVPFFLSLLAEALGETGHLDQGLQYLGEAGRLMAETEERWAAPSCIEPEANCWAPLKVPPRPNTVLAKPLRLRDSKARSSGSCARLKAWCGCGAIKGSGMRPENFSLRSTAGLPRASTHPISKRQKHCSTHWREPATGMCRNPAQMSLPWLARPPTGVDQEWFLRVDLSQTIVVPRTAGNRHLAALAADNQDAGAAPFGCKRT